MGYADRWGMIADGYDESLARQGADWIDSRILHYEMLEAISEVGWSQDQLIGTYLWTR